MLFIVLICVYATLLIIDSKIDVKMLSPNIYSEEELNKFLTFLNVSENILLIIISIIGTTMVTAPLVEVKQKNIMYGDLIANDIFSSPEIYKHFSLDNKKKILNYLEKEIYFSNSEFNEYMYDKIRNLICISDFEYYYQKCEYSITFDMHQDYLKQTFSKTLFIRSTNESSVINGLSLAKAILKEIPNQDIFIPELLIIGEQNIDINKNCKINYKKSTNQIFVKNGYDMECEWIYKKRITLCHSKDTIIRLCYTICKPLDNNTIGVRVNVPCKEFIFRAIAPSEYKLSAHTYGLWNNMQYNQMGNLDNEISIIFSDWIIPNNGLSLAYHRISDLN